MRTDERMHHELAAAMQFPSYYGENSNAFFECIRDLSWLGDVGLVLLVTDASQVLRDDDHGPETFWSALVDARQAWPKYAWMGVAKAALESTARYLARDLGPRKIRVNLVAAGPLRTVAARSIPGFSDFEDVWQQRAPLGWDVNDPEPAARATAALLSDWFPATTGEMVHVDGGFHAVGA